MDEVGEVYYFANKFTEIQFFASFHLHSLLRIYKVEIWKPIHWQLPASASTPRTARSVGTDLTEQ